MGIWDSIKSLLSAGVPLLANAIFPGSGGFVGGILSSFFGCDNKPETIKEKLENMTSEELLELKKLEIKHRDRLIELGFKAMEAQTDINMQEAKHPKIFVSGWRPFIGWVCGIGLLCNYILTPIIDFILDLLGIGNIPPIFDTSELLPLVMSLLGLGGMRTYEKYKGVNGRH
jgi:hypothetical protein